MNVRPFPDYYPLISNVLLLLHIPSPHEDELQEAYFVYHECVETYEPAKSKFSTYYHQKLKYHFQSALRKEKYQKEMMTRILVLHPSTHTDHYFLHPPLNDREERIFRFSMEGYTTTDIASLLSISKSTVLRERKKLRHKFSFYVSSTAE